MPVYWMLPVEVPHSYISTFSGAFRFQYIVASDATTFATGAFPLRDFFVRQQVGQEPGEFCNHHKVTNRIGDNTSAIERMARHFLWPKGRQDFPH